MKILPKEPEEVVNPWNCNTSLDIELGLFTGFREGALAQKRAYEAAIADVDLDKMAQQWFINVPYVRVGTFKPQWGKSFTEYLKEQLGVKHEEG